MKKLFVLILGIFLLSGTMASAQEIVGRDIVTLSDGVRIWQSGSQWGYQIDFKEAVTASTLRVLFNGALHDVPIYGIVAPSTDYPVGAQAKQWVEKYIDEMKVDLQPRFHSISEGQVGIDVDVIFAVDLVEAGFAWVVPGVAAKVPETGTMTYERILVEAQSYARANMLGIWESSDPAQPWKRYK